MRTHLRAVYNLIESAYNNVALPVPHVYSGFKTMPPTPPDYQNFDLTLESVPEGYLVSVLASPAGEKQEPLLVDGFDERELSNFLTYIDRALDEIDADPSGEYATALADECHLFGASLFKTIFVDDVLSLWRTSLATANGGQGLRLRLRLTKAPELNGWPWEFLYDPVEDSYLALTIKTPIMRYLEMPVAIEPLQIQPPLRILVIAPDPIDLPELAVGKELQKLEQGLKSLKDENLVEVVRLSPPNLSALLPALRKEQYHIVHFIGHGEFDPEKGTKGYGALAFEDDQRKSRMESATRVGNLLRDHESLRLVVLNACEGGRVAMDSPFGGIAQTLARKGIPAVCAMQFEITDDAAIAFSAEFYAALADGYPVDAALTQARLAIYAAGNEVEWVTPVLFMRANDGSLFTPPAPPAPTDEKQAEAKIGTQENGQPDDQSAVENSGRQKKMGVDGDIQVNIADSTFTDSTFNIGHGIGGDQPAAAGGETASTAMIADNQAIELTRLEGRIRRSYRRLLDFEDRLSLSKDDGEKADWQQQIDERTPLLRTLIEGYTTQRPSQDWPMPTDIREAMGYFGMG